MNIVSKKFPNPLANSHTKEVEIFFDEDSKEPVSSNLRSGNLWSSSLATVSSFFWDRNSTIVDIGTHIGTYSALAASVTENKVISIEPDPSNFELLLKNKEINNFHHQVCHNFAASDKEGSVNFCPNGPSSHILQEDGTEAAIEVPCKPLDSLLSRENVSFVKMDVEGWELNVLEGMAKTIHRCCPPIVFEVNGFTLKWFNKSPNDLLRLLEEKFDYRIFALTDHFIPVNCYEPFPFGVIDCFALKPKHLNIINQFISPPLSFRERKDIFMQTCMGANEDFKGYLDWYKQRQFL